MEHILLPLINHIAQNLPELSLVDEDYGQLETQEDTYPVTFPCVLVGNTVSEWTTTHSLSQRSETTFSVRLAIDCYDDTHYGSTTTDKIQERQALSKKLITLLHGWRATVPATVPCGSPQGSPQLIRKKSQYYPLPGGIKVYETSFSVRLSEEF